jgi:hypothetical protein
MADGLFSGILPYLYSKSNKLKKTVKELIDNPLGVLEQSASFANDRAKILNDLTKESTNEVKTGEYKATKELLALLASGYNPAGIVIGPASRTWNKAMADKFLELEKKGLNSAELWKVTGTFRSPEGALKQELPDNLMKLRTTFDASLPSKANEYKGGIEGPIGGMVEHSDLFKAYPDLLTNTRYTVTKQPGWLPESAETAQYSKTFGGKEKISTNTKTEEEALNKLVHELQHAIQSREKGWQGGGLETQFKDTPSMSAFEQYRRLAGEAEARAVAARRTMTPEQRANTLPTASYDVPLEELIYRDPFKK